MRIHKKLGAAVAFAILLLAWRGWGWSASGRGRMVARFDVARGHYQVLGYGLVGAGRPQYARILRERYNIESRQAVGCIVSPSLRAYAKGYNAVSMAAANLKYGRDIFEESWEAAGIGRQHRTAGKREQKQSRSNRSQSPRDNRTTAPQGLVGGQISPQAGG